MISPSLLQRRSRNAWCNSPLCGHFESCIPLLERDCYIEDYMDVCNLLESFKLVRVLGEWEGDDRALVLTAEPHRAAPRSF